MRILFKMQRLLNGLWNKIGSWDKPKRRNKYGRRYNYSKDKNIRRRIKETSIKTRFCKKNSVLI